MEVNDADIWVLPLRVLVEASVQFEAVRIGDSKIVTFAGGKKMPAWMRAELPRSRGEYRNLGGATICWQISSINFIYYELSTEKPTLSPLS